MSTATSAAWASVVVATITAASNVWQAYDAHLEKQAAMVAKETLLASQVRVEALNNKVAIQEASLSNALERASLYGDILAAGGGDRWAYKRVYEYLLPGLLSKDKSAEALIQQLNSFTRHFIGNVKDNSILQYYMMGPASENLKEHIKDMLRREDVGQRICALKHILWLRLNEHIPLVVDSLEREPDLNVVQLAVHVINETFSDNMCLNDHNPVYVLSVDDCALRYCDFKSRFLQMWNTKKDKILARKSKEVRERPDPPRGNLTYIYDPEKPDSAM